MRTALHGKGKVDVFNVCEVSEMFDKEVLHGTIDKVGNEDSRSHIAHRILEKTTLKVLCDEMSDDERPRGRIVDERNVPDVAVDNL